MTRRVDLRSDTVTTPTPAMREAMAHAPVGDDGFGEDPTIAALEARYARMVGKDEALFVPSGVMANQIALRVLTRPGDATAMPEPADLISDYGATNEAEFFAVVTEVFFEQAAALAQRHPALFALLSDYYAVDPRTWHAPLH